MSVLAPPRHPIVAQALQLARQWCAGHLIDNAPALTHAVRVAVVLGRYLPDAAPHLIAAVLLHDSPELAPPTVDLDSVLSTRLGPAVTAVVRALQREHHALDHHSAPDLCDLDRSTLCASAADKIVSLGSVLGRADRAPDRGAYWATRGAFLSRVPYFRAFHAAAAPHLPAGMSSHLSHLVVSAEHAANQYHRRSTPGYRPAHPLKIPSKTGRHTGPSTR